MCTRDFCSESICISSPWVGLVLMKIHPCEFHYISKHKEYYNSLLILRVLLTPFFINSRNMRTTITLREEIFAGRNFCGIYFCDRVPPKQRILRNLFLRIEPSKFILRNKFLRSGIHNLFCGIYFCDDEILWLFEMLHKSQFLTFRTPCIAYN